MDAKVNLPFKQLLSIVRHLSPSEKEILKEELTNKSVKSSSQYGLRDLLLKGPVFTEEQIKEIEDVRKQINQWRTKL